MYCKSRYISHYIIVFKPLKVSKNLLLIPENMLKLKIQERPNLLGYSISPKLSDFALQYFCKNNIKPLSKLKCNGVLSFSNMSISCNIFLSLYTLFKVLTLSKYMVFKAYKLAIANLYLSLFYYCMSFWTCNKKWTLSSDHAVIGSYCFSNSIS